MINFINIAALMDQRGTSRIIKVATFNQWINLKNYPQRYPLIVQVLKNLFPDIIGLQEVLDRTDKSPNQAELIASEFHYIYKFFGITKDIAGLEGLSILSRYPILESDALQLSCSTPEETRGVLYALIGAPMTKLRVYCTHLSWKPDENYKRESQVLDIHHFVKKHDSRLPVIILGDFNDTPDSKTIRFLTAKQSLQGELAYYQDAWNTIHPRENGFTWSKKNCFARAMNRPDRRIDYIFVSPPDKDGKGHIRDCRIIMNRPDALGIFPSDHFGILAEICY